MKRKRLNFIFLVFFICFIVLSLRLFKLTIVEGDVYRDFSDNNRIKQIDNDASRGIIYDRNGNELASNRAIYNVNAYSDRFNEIEDNRKNLVMQHLIRIFEEEGINYLSDFEFDIYTYQYKNKNDYFTEKNSPDEKVINLIQENDLLEKILYSSYNIDENIKFFPLKRVNEYLVSRGKNLPLKFIFDKQIKIEFEKNDVYEKLIKDKTIDHDTSPISFLISELKDDSSFINYLLSHPISRKIVYDILEEKNINNNIVLSDLVYSYDNKYIEHKSFLNKFSDKITLDSDAKSDFLNLVKDNSIENLLTKAYETKKGIVIPASILINELEKKGINTNIEYTVIDDNKVELKYKDGKTYENDEIVQELISLSENNNVLDQFILNDQIIILSQRSLFEKNIYPRIYINSWEYTYLKDKKDLFLNKEELTVEQLFEKRKNEYELELDNDYIMFALMSVYANINSQGFLSYNPVTIAKDLNKDAVKKIEDQMPNDIGIEVVVQPSRYYPNGNLASHVLGYIGKISESDEIEEYVEYKKYDPNDSVGKTGLEESFEDTLRGSKGKKLVFTDVYGNTTDVIEETSSIPGNNLYTTLDINLQSSVEEILADAIDSIKHGSLYKSFYEDKILESSVEATSAASVVMNVKTGEILSLASYPSYNPNLFVNGISNYDWNKLNDYEDDDLYAPRPILNNAFQAYTPGSTFKIVMSLAALENGLNPNSTINNFGYIQLGSTRYNDLIYTLTGSAWGPLNLYDALKVSSNYYFYVLGLGYNPRQEGDNDIKVELKDVQSMTKRLGLQDPTNIEINVPFESSGLSPSIEGKKALIKSMLRIELDGNLEKYIKDNANKSEKEINDDLRTILSWVDDGNTMTRDEVIDNIERMGYKAEEPLEGKIDGLADIIKYSYLNMSVWTESDSVNMAIGQGQNAYTALQLVNLASIVANEGVKVQPTLVKEIKNYLNDKTIFSNEVKSETVDVNPEYFRDVKEGMRRASLYNGYTNRKNLPFEVGSKTGTAQLRVDPITGDELLAVSELAFAPYNDPEIAIFTVVIGGSVSSIANEINTDIIYSYFKYVKNDERFTNERIEKDEKPQENLTED